MTKSIQYDIHEHAHRFAIWTATIAATRGMAGGTTENIEKAIGKISCFFFDSNDTIQLLKGLSL